MLIINENILNKAIKDTINEMVDEILRDTPHIYHRTLTHPQYFDFEVNHPEYTDHFFMDRKERITALQNIFGGFGQTYLQVWVKNGHESGPEIHTITTNGIVIERNKKTRKFVTAYALEPYSLEEYYTLRGKEVPDDILRIVCLNVISGVNDKTSTGGSNTPKIGALYYFKTHLGLSIETYYEIIQKYKENEYLKALFECGAINKELYDRYQAIQDKLYPPETEEQPEEQPQEQPEEQPEEQPQEQPQPEIYQTPAETKMQKFNQVGQISPEQLAKMLQDRKKDRRRR